MMQKNEENLKKVKKKFGIKKKGSIFASRNKKISDMKRKNIDVLDAIVNLIMIVTPLVLAIWIIIWYIMTI